MSTQTDNESSSLPISLDEILKNRLLDDSDADIILHSCDHHEFRVLKLHIIKASPVLRDLIHSASSSNTANTTTSLPSVQLSDSGTILSSLLTFVLPMLPVTPSTIEQTMTLLSAAQKYQMDSVLSRIRGALASQDPPFIRKETAFRVYSLARAHGLCQEALEAARSTLSFTFALEELEDEVDTVHGIYLHELWKYYGRVQTHLTEYLKFFKTAVITQETIGQPCNNGTPPWLNEYIDSIAKSPALFDITEFHMYLARHIDARPSRCKCANIPRTAIDAFWTALTKVVHGCMTKAGSDIVTPAEPQNGPSLASLEQDSAMPDRLNMSDADIIIQSCDLVNFRVHKSALSLSSSIFGDMFSLPQPSNDEAVDGLPVVRLSEDAEVLHSLLTMLYPIPSVIPQSYDKSLMLLAASQKYDMVGVQSHIRAEIQSRKFPTPTGSAAFREYAIASCGRLPSERISSALLTLDFPMTFDQLCDALPLFEGWALRDLIDFRKRCRDNLVSCFQSLLNPNQPPLNIWICGANSHSHFCSEAITTGYHKVPSWLVNLFEQHLNELDQAFTKPLLNPAHIRDEYMSALQAHTASNSYITCIACMVVHTMKGETFCKQVKDRLTTAISEACASSKLT